jgi:type II/III secretion system protein
VTLHRATMVIIALLVGGLAVVAQDVQPPTPPQPAPAARGRGPVVPLEVQVTISRYQGEKRMSAAPYVLAVNTNTPEAQLTMNVDVPVSTNPVSDDKDRAAPFVSFNYRSVGTNIVCGAQVLDDGRYELTIGIDESTVVPTPDATSGTSQVGTRGGMPAFRNFKSRNRILLRDGQTRQYTAATDRITGETVRIEVNLKVVK